jgi:hypothetical protein
MILGRFLQSFGEKWRFCTNFRRKMAILTNYGDKKVGDFAEINVTIKVCHEIAACQSKSPIIHSIFLAKISLKA